MKKLSIITICYNEPNLEKTCESIVNQTWQDFEWIVIDGGSNEETLKIFDKYKYRIDKFISEPDNGRYNAMNKGIKLATGYYLNFLNAGDSYFHNDILKDLFADKNYTSDVLYGFEYVNRNNLCKDEYIQAMPKKINKSFFLKTTLRHQASFIKREVFDKYGLYDESYIMLSDVEKWLKLKQENAVFERIPYIVTAFDSCGISYNEKYRSLSRTETVRILEKYFTPRILNIVEKSKEDLSFAENIFSFKNSYAKRYKIVTILGMKFRFKKK